MKIDDIVEMIVIKNRDKALALSRGRTPIPFNRKKEGKDGSRSVGFVKKFWRVSCLEKSSRIAGPTLTASCGW